MNRIEEVKKIFAKAEFDGGLIELDNEEEIIKQINQLYEPQPDQSGLLKDEEIEKIWQDEHSRKNIGVDSLEETDDLDVVQTLLEAQRDLTASIKDAELHDKLMSAERCGWDNAEGYYKARIEALIEEIHNWSGEKCTEHDGNTSMNSIRRKDCGKCWEELKATRKGEK